MKFYDELGRLVEERYDTPNTADDFISRYGYDLASNRVRLEQDYGNADPASFIADDTTSYNVDKNDRLLSEATIGALLNNCLECSVDRRWTEFDISSDGAK